MRWGFQSSIRLDEPAKSWLISHASPTSIWQNSLPVPTPVKLEVNKSSKKSVPLNDVSSLIDHSFVMSSEIMILRSRFQARRLQFGAKSIISQDYIIHKGFFEAHRWFWFDPLFLFTCGREFERTWKWWRSWHAHWSLYASNEDTMIAQFWLPDGSWTCSNYSLHSLELPCPFQSIQLGLKLRLFEQISVTILCRPYLVRPIKKS